MIRLFAQHKVAANLLMILIFLAGVWGVARLNTQFLPTFNVHTITISVAWPGASAEDVQASITVPIEDRLRGLDHVKKMTAISGKNLSFIVVTFRAKTNMSDALQQVTNFVGAVPNLPQDSRKPVVTRIEIYDAIAKVLIYTDDDVSALTHYAHQFERQLLDRGIAKVAIKGIAKKEIRIGLSAEQLADLGMSLNQLAKLTAAQSENISAGTVGVKAGGRTVRSVGQKYQAKEYRGLPIISGDVGQLMRLLNVATIEEQPVNYPQLIHYKGHPALNLTLYRTPSTDALKSAQIMHQWIKEVKPTLPASIHLKVYDESWILIKQRMMLLLKNGGGGLLLIFVLLFVFLNHRVATWVAMGIPISLAAAMFILELSGGSINMVSMFAIILTFGIIVDDTIVVAEEGVTQFEKYKRSPLDAAVSGAERMRKAVFASSLTTVAAFVPLLFLGGVYGEILFDIPQVVVCVIIASLVEAFLILPNHTMSSLKKIAQSKPPKYRMVIDAWFNRIRDNQFRRFVTLAIRYCWVTLAVAVALIVLVVGVLISGRLHFNFFPTPDGSALFADVTFMGGTPTSEMKAYLHRLEQSAYQVGQQMGKDGEPLVKSVVMLQHDSTHKHETRSTQRLGALWIELSSPSERMVTNDDFLKAWRKVIPQSAAVEDIRMHAPKADDHGSAIDIALSGGSLTTLKKASLDLQRTIKGYSGTYNVTDNLPYAPDEFVFSLKPEAMTVGLTLSDVGAQVRAALAGELVEIINRGKEEIDVRVGLTKNATESLSSLKVIPIVLPNSRVMPLGALCNIHSQRNYDSITRTDYFMAVHVLADVNHDLGNTTQIINALKATALPALTAKYGVKYEFKGRYKDRQRTLTEMKMAVLFTLVLIYIILAWVSGSYLWPLFVMVAIPLGLVGAIVGHLVLGLNLTLLSLFGFFGLTGIVINDSIILLLRYKELKDRGETGVEAIVDACCQRFRAVMLTSLTTIAGLSPLLFERSLQARFLIPMATSICFGLAFATLLILVVIPTLLSLTERTNNRMLTDEHAQ